MGNLLPRLAHRPLAWPMLLGGLMTTCSGTRTEQNPPHAEPPTARAMNPATPPTSPDQPIANIGEFPPGMPSATLDTNTAITRVAFGSCYVPQFERSKIWQSIAATEPDLFLFLGDNVYQSEENGRPELLELREAYTALAHDGDFARLRRSTPVVPTWDDHDYGLNDAGGEFTAKWQSEALFEAVWALEPNDPRRARPGVYVQYVIGPPRQRLQVIVLDTRFFRSPRTDGPNAGSMLGDEQWTWLTTVLRQPAEIRLLVSSIPVLSERGVGESWRGWPQERERLLTLLASSPTTTVILSGDTHYAAFYGQTISGYGALLEIGASSLNFPLPEKARTGDGFTDANRLDDPYFEPNFGLFEIDWATREVDLKIRSEAGVDVLSRTMTLK